MEKKEKKKKLTLTVSSKKNYSPSNYSNFGNKKSVIIEKKISRSKNDRRFSKRM